MSEAEAALYENALRAWCEETCQVRHDRITRNEPRLRMVAARRPAPDMRAASRRLARYVATPRVSKHRLFVWADAATLPDHGVYVFARDDDYFFGVLHSRSARALGASARAHSCARRRAVSATPPPPPSRPSPSPGPPATNPPAIPAWRPSPRPPATWSPSATPGSTRPARLKPNSRSAPSPTSTTSAPPGSTSPTESSTPPSSPPTAGPPTSPTTKSSPACSPSTWPAPQVHPPCAQFKCDYNHYGVISHSVQYMKHQSSL